MGIFVILVIIFILYCAIQNGKEEAAIQKRMKREKHDAQKYEQIKKSFALSKSNTHKS